jgi:Flp pilus assembly protein TadD
MRRICLLFVMLLAGATSAGVIELKDGTRLEGDVKRTPDGWTITAADGAVQNVAPDAVKSIQLGSSQKSGESAEALASLRRSALALGDINQIIDRYQHFIAGASDPQVRADAQGDLATWQQRKDQGLIKHGSKWINPADAATFAAQAGAAAEQARDLIRQNRMKEADQLLQQALSDDPTNPSALYLRGVVLFRQEKLVDARKSFEGANAAEPNDAPTLNNVAVVLWRQNQQPGAMNFYDQAMQAQPVNKFILDNVAEALGTMPDDLKKSPAVARALRRFTEQDTLLQQRMASQGQYRWGSMWVDQKKLDELKVAEKQIHEKMAAMQNDFDQTKSRISAIDSEMQQNQQIMNDLQVTAVVTDGKGHVIYTPLPQSYYDLQAKNNQLKSEQDSLKSKMASLQDQAKNVQQQVPVPQFTGVQQIVGVEGMPQSPATQPTSAPS